MLTRHRWALSRESLEVRSSEFGVGLGQASYTNISRTKAPFQTKRVENPSSRPRSTAENSTETQQFLNSQAQIFRHRSEARLSTRYRFAVRMIWVIAICRRASRTLSGRANSSASEQEIDPHLEAAAIHRRVYRAGGPALYLRARSRDGISRWSSNLFGNIERTRFLFRDTLDAVRKLIELKTRSDERISSALAILERAAHRVADAAEVRRAPAPVLAHTTTLSQLPQLQCWPLDGGAFVTLPAGVHRAPGPLAAGRSRTSACIACSSPATSTNPTASAGCITRFIAGSVTTTPQPSRAAKPLCERGHRRAAGARGCGRDAVARGDAGTGVRRRAGRPTGADV